ncbi:PEP/pyruvate-binding domain-containing protein [Thermomonospora umbrina]|uniref:Pyruvate,water dikinase n=1 Tax=Thermomonospora umbrina TaxID=111806 RepID=A0A3D9T1C1_9ACTN|nr:PEP/pyruvate-binding domain-containing protein [Thermomonospora umbrina]REE97621.1 pyruvate,water dikinase [Thermomonospora umbrina]
MQHRELSILRLDHSMAADPELTGAKAANLARAAGHGLPVLPGFVIPIPVTGDLDTDLSLKRELRAAWSTLSDDGNRTLVVRSSSTAEDGAASSMAGRFVSVLGVRDRTSFRAAVSDVLESAHGPGTMAVLVQPQLDAVAGGVMFGADPVDGRTDRVVVSAVSGGPHTLVGGEADGTRYVLTGRGRLVEEESPDGPLSRPRLRALARLAARAAAVFGGPQDVEFAFDADGTLWLLQSRPVTALAPSSPRGATLLGPGPVAETLPDALSPLEEDLWLVPLDHGVSEALATVGAVSRRTLRRSPTVRSVGGRAAADLRRLGAAPGRPSRLRLRLLNPLPPMRRLSVAWQVGRLRVELPALAAETAAAVDTDLAAVPPLAELTDADLVAALHWSRSTLAALHGLEALAGSLLNEEAQVTTAQLALIALHRDRERGWEDPRIRSEDPVVLALAPPAIDAPAPLPAVTSDGAPAVGRSRGGLPPRELLRLRIRWVQELSARVAWAAGQRLHKRGALARPEVVRALHLSELEAVLEGGSLPADVEHRPAPPHTPPLPAAFRLAGDRIVAEAAPSGDGARAAGGGRATGPVHSGDGDPAPGSILVVGTLAPSLAVHLPKVAGLVAETGSPLSHLAILARELGVPTVVAARGALDRFPPGTRLFVDGDTGRVEPLPPTSRSRSGEESVA